MFDRLLDIAQSYAAPLALPAVVAVFVLVKRGERLLWGELKRLASETPNKLDDAAVNVGSRAWEISTIKDAQAILRERGFNGVVRVMDKAIKELEK